MIKNIQKNFLIIFIILALALLSSCVARNSEDVDDAGDVKYNNDAQKDVTDKDSDSWWQKCN